MALVIGNSQFKFMHYYIQDPCILTLSYTGFRLDQLGSKLEDIATATIILSPGCQQPFLIKMAGDNRLSAATSFLIFFKMEVYCVFSLESPHRGDSNVYTQYAIFIIGIYF